MNEILFCMLILVVGGFVKFCVALQIFRYGLGLYGGGIGFIVLVIAAIFSIFLSNNIIPIEQLFSSNTIKYQDLRQDIIPFLESKTDPNEVLKLRELGKKNNYKKLEATQVVSPDSNNEDELPSLLLAFSISELKIAFQIGLLFILPFLLIDILVAHILQLLAITQISAVSFALPLKLVLFIAVDGWSLISQRLIGM